MRSATRQRPFNLLMAGVIIIKKRKGHKLPYPVITHAFHVTCY